MLLLLANEFCAQTQEEAGHDSQPYVAEFTSD